jgi:hypothetical protein
MYRMDFSVQNLDGFLSPICSQALGLYCNGSELCKLSFILNCCCREIACDSTQAVTRSVGCVSGPAVCVYEL